MARVLHFDCFSGVSGDMTLGALIDLGVPEPLIREALGSLGLEGELKVERVRKAGLAAVHIRVEAPPGATHRHLSHIRKIVEKGKLTDGARAIADRMFLKLAEAEAASHGIAVEKVHFHEVGAVDSIFDFVGVAVGLDWLGVDYATSRPVPTGCGTIVCEHGTLPVPAPATARMLVGVPLAESAIEAELTTPTGAAILATFVKKFGPMPAMTIEKIGFGAGTRDLPGQPNVLRLVLGATPQPAGRSDRETDEVWQVETNLDDVPGEIVGYCMERLFAAGALDAFVQPIQMKKQRPGVLVTALVPDEKLAAVEAILFSETTALGVRRTRVQRSKLKRRTTNVSTPWGPVKGKLAWDGERWIFSPEFEDCARIAREHATPLRRVYEAASASHAAGAGE